MTEKIKKRFKKLGPGFITGASDDDPSGIAVYSQAGAQFGLSQLWMALWSWPFLSVLQEMSARVGMVTGKGLARVIGENYSRSILYLTVLVLVIVNTINIGADLGAMASSARLVVDVPFYLIIFILAAGTLLLEVFIPYRIYAKYLKFLTLFLLAYIGVAFVVNLNWSSVFYATFIPRVHLSRDFLLSIMAVLGTTIAPYLFFWQSNQEVEEEIINNRIGSHSNVPQITKKDIGSMRFDTSFGMLLSNVIMFFIILSAASTLGISGIHDIQTADQAAAALKPISGNFASLLFALGILGTGLLAVPILAASASFAISEVFGWKEGLGLKFKRAVGFYSVIIIATLIGLIINFTSIPVFKMLYYSAILNGIAAPPIIVLLVLTSNSKKIMGEFTNSKFSNIMGWIIGIIMAVMGIFLITTLV